MSHIKKFKFDKQYFNEIRSYRFGKNWPVVYLLSNKKELYVGETINAFLRSKQHYEREERAKLDDIHIITDEEYNKSAARDIESLLIQNFVADGKYLIQNGNAGLQNHNYYEREKYLAKFEVIWEELRKLDMAHKSLHEIKNSDLFKYSPYKSLTDDQMSVVNNIFHDLVHENSDTYIVHGRPGTGKTIVAVYLMKFLKEHKKTKNLSIALVVPMTGLRKTLKKVFRNVAGLSSSMIIGPSDVIRNKYDVLLVDEAHRLKKRKNITNFQSFDLTNKYFNLGNDGTELDWIMRSSSHQIFFYDEFQSIRPSDIGHQAFKELSAKNIELNSQMRVQADGDYIQFIEDLFDPESKRQHHFNEYEIRMFDDISEMYQTIKEKDKEHGLSRMVAGYAWPWKTKKDRNAYDIEIDGLNMRWNSTTGDWVNSANALNEIGCIHTVQGYDLNYVGVIIGSEISFDEEQRKIVVDKSKYFDANGKRSIANKEELQRYIINIYKTLLTRGIRGTYIYVIDEKLKKFFRETLK